MNYDPDYRMSFAEALKEPFVPEESGPFFDIPVAPHFGTRHLSRHSYQYNIIETYLQNTCLHVNNQIRQENVKIFQYKNAEEEVCQFENANWLLWTGVKSDNLWSIKRHGLCLPDGPREALFFTPSFAMALQYTDLQSIKYRNSGLSCFYRERYQNQRLYVLLCEVALGTPFVAKSRYLWQQIDDLDSKEFEDWLCWRDKFPKKYENGFKVTRYQDMDSSLEDGELMMADEVIEVAKDENCDSVFTWNASLEPSNATIWNGRILPDGKLYNYRVSGDVDHESNHAYSEAFIWNTQQVAIRYIVEFRADYIKYLEN